MIQNFANIEQFISIILIHLFAVISPGPDFAIVVNQSTKYGRKSGILTSVGIAFGIIGHIFYCIIGVGFLISQNIYIFNIIKIVGAIYLCYLGVNSFKRTKASHIDVNIRNYFKNPFFIGLVTSSIFSGRIVRPLQLLVSGTKKVGKGHFDFHIVIAPIVGLVSCEVGTLF